jgi:type II secretory pathway pseudopilin PulG
MKSFTLIELLVVVSLILILSVLIVPNFHLTNSKLAVERAAYKLAQDFRNTEEMAMSSRGTSLSLFGSTLFPRGGYGLSFTDNSNSYILFADCNDNQVYDTAKGSPVSCAQSGSANTRAELIKEIFLESGVKITAASLKQITFFPPDPIIRTSPALPSHPSVILTSVKDQTKGFSVDVNEVGRIEITPWP